MPEESNFYAALVASSDDAIVAKDIDGIILSWNPAAERLFGYSSAEMVGNSVRRLLPPDRQHEEDDILARIRAGEKVGQQLTQRLHKDGRLIDVWVTVSPVRDDDGTIVGASKFARDAGAYLQNQRELHEAKDKFETLANTIAPMAWIAGTDGKIVWYSQRWYDFTGKDYDHMMEHGSTGILHPDHVERVIAHYYTSMQGREEWEDIFPLKRHDGEYRWFLSRAKPIRNAAGEVLRWFGTNSDITEQREQAEQIRLLLMEVNHRSKNMLATIQALLRRSVEGQDEFVRRFQERVRSLAVNQDILVRREWREVPLAELAEMQLDFVQAAAGTITLDGADIALNPRAAETIGMALHELATNSLKHGALSRDQGQVQINWRVDGADFLMDWRESGGPPVSPPTKSGFGTTLICEVPRRALGATAEIDYAPAGIVWRMSAPLVMVKAGSLQ